MSARFDAADRLMRAAVTQRVFPGAVLWIAVGPKVLFCEPYGWANLFSRQAMTCDTVFDLASLTKPLATSLAVMDLVRQGALALDRPLGRRWPGWPVEKQCMTVRQLLSHRSGLPPWRPYFMQLRHLAHPDRLPALRSRLTHEPLQSAPGERSAYSDLGYMLLQWLVEETVGQTLDAYVTSTIYRSLGIESLFFIELARSQPSVPYAATELCPWRKTLLCGQVHDDNAYVLGGVAGHAGLFGTAGAVGALLLALLAPDRIHEPPAWLDRSMLALFLQRQTGGTFALGFDTPSEINSSAGDFFSDQSVGHLGFTGTSFWMDRRGGIIVVLLTNRVHPSRHNERLRHFRPHLHNAVMKAFLKQGVSSEEPFR